MKKIVVLISGEGSNLQALIDACKSGLISGEIIQVISNRMNAFGLERAALANIPTQVFQRQDYVDTASMNLAMAEHIQQLQPDLIVLAGFMQILSAEFVNAFAGKILNIHPSLLPKYAGLNTYQRAMANQEKEHGMSIHFVNEEVDAGAIILQAKVPIFPEDSLQDLEMRVKTQEHLYYPLVVKWFVDERLCLKDGMAYLDGKKLPKQGYASDEN